MSACRVYDFNEISVKPILLWSYRVCWGPQTPVPL